MATWFFYCVDYGYAHETPWITSMCNNSALLTEHHASGLTPGGRSCTGKWVTRLASSATASLAPC